MLGRAMLVLTSAFIVSCSSIKNLQEGNSLDKNVLDDMFYYQGKYNDTMITECLIESDTSSLSHISFTSFEVLFFLDKLRKSRSEELWKLFRKSNVIYSIEYLYNREIYAHYWNDKGNYSIYRKTLPSQSRVIQKLANKIPDFELIKDRMNQGDDLNIILDELKKKYDYVHKKDKYILSRYTCKDDIITKSTFSIW